MSKMPTMTLLSVLLILSCVACCLSRTSALDNGLALFPPMGWNSWNLYDCDIDEHVMRRQADRLVDLGLADAGYVYVNIDDCWMAPNRTSDDGNYRADPVKFPSGIAALAEYVHARGLLLGIYTSAGTMTCQGLPGSLGHEVQDARTFASWGVDYLKYDNCYNQHIPSIDRYSVMRDALLATGRPIFYSLCQWGNEDSWRWAPSVGNSWRTTGDIGRSWKSIETNFWKNQRHIERAGPGGWADPDMLEIGVANLTRAEEQSHFALWIMAKAPLLLAMDLGSTISPETLKIVTNPQLLAVHQDPHSLPATCFVGCQDWSRRNWSVLATRVGNGDTVALVINWSDTKKNSNANRTKNNAVVVSFAGQDVGVVPSPDERVTVTDLWDNMVVGTYDFEGLKSIATRELEPHGCAVYRFTVTKKKSAAADSML